MSNILQNPRDGLTVFLRPGLPKNIHYLYYFEITNIPNFRRTLREVVLLLITTAQEVKSTPDKNRLVGLNMSFSAIGLSKLGLTESLHDDSFDKGQLLDAQSLGDSGIERGGHWTPNWDSEFKADIHGVFLVTAHPDTDNEAKQLIKILETSFVPDVRRASLKKILLSRGSLRPGDNWPNDFFGFRDGISKPEIEDVTFSKTEPMRYTGSSVVDMGVIVMGHDGDEDKAKRPSWAIDGSFMVFRKLKMFAPEFEGFVKQDSARVFPNLDPKAAQDLYGARLVGRWKSGKDLTFLHSALLPTPYLIYS
jgi:deferrochelatase/peroxidase EfeB